MKFEFISRNVGRYALKELCEALDVAPSAYHASRTRPPGARAGEDARLKREILEIHKRAKGEYGHRPVHQHLVEDLGLECGRDRTLRLMRELGVAGTRCPRYKPQGTDSDHDFGCHPNRLKEHGNPGNRNELETLSACASAELPRLAYRVQEVAQMLGVSEKTVRRLIVRGYLKPSRALRHLLIPRGQVEKFLKSTSR